MEPLLWVAGAIVTGIGLYLRISLQKRKEIRRKIDALLELVEAVETAAYDFYARAPDDAKCKELAQMIRCKVKQSGAHAARLNILLPESRASSLLIRFRQVVTGGEFESSSRDPSPGTDPLFEKISQASRNLRHSLETEFEKTFKAH